MKATLTIDGYTVEFEGTPEEVTKAINQLTPKTIPIMPMPLRDGDWMPSTPWPYPPITIPLSPVFPPYTVTCGTNPDNVQS